MTIAQVFCSVNDLVESLSIPGGVEAVLRRHVFSASEYLAKEIGWFIPVTDTVAVDGYGTTHLVIPPMLSISNLTHYGTALSSPADYLLYPSGREWLNGPYSWLEVAPNGSKISAWMELAQVVSITGQIGLYNLAGATGATLSANQLIGDTSFSVNDGSKLSPGTIVLIESEQQLVTATRAPVTSSTTLSVSAAVSDDTLTLADETKVNVGEIIRMDLEQMKVLDKNPTTHQISAGRGWNGTKKNVHTSGVTVEVYRSFDVTRAVNGTTAIQHNSSTAVSRYQVPEDLGFLAREIAGLMLKKEMAGYAGRTGDAQLGTVFYNDAFPRDDLARIKSLYTVRGQ